MFSDSIANLRGIIYNTLQKEMLPAIEVTKVLIGIGFCDT